MKVLVIDANVFLHVVAPELSVTSPEEVKASAALVRAVQKSEVTAIGPSIVVAEMKWAVGRMADPAASARAYDRLLDIEASFPDVLGEAYRLVDIDATLASRAADYRLKYYSKKNPFSYNDALYLATAVFHRANYLVTTDSHLLQVKEVKALTPAGFARRAGRRETRGGRREE